jgi:hypothetical protein
MTNYVPYWSEEQFKARIERLSVNGYINRAALRKLIDSQLASPAIKSRINDILINNLSKQALHVKYDLGIGHKGDARPSRWTATEVFEQLARLVDKEHYIKNDSQRWTVETISRASIKEIMYDVRVPESYQRNLALYLEQNPCRRIFKLEHIENFLRQSIPETA